MLVVLGAGVLVSGGVVAGEGSMPPLVEGVSAFVGAFVTLLEDVGSSDFDPPDREAWRGAASAEQAVAPRTSRIETRTFS